MSKKSTVIRAIEGFNSRAFEPHHPDIMCITCIDARERAGGNFAFEDNAVRVTEISAVIPPYESASYNTRAKFSFRKIKNVSAINITGHSFCGGAQIAISHPDASQAPDPEVRDIVQSIADSGADLVRLRDSFMRACEGNVVHAANLLSRHLVLVSLYNVSRYPYINEQIMTNKLDVIPLYHMLKEGSGEISHLERYDVDQRSWVRLPENTSTHMCDRPDNCGSCQSCHATIETSLDWVPLNTLIDGEIAVTEVPLHISRLMRGRQEFYQPQLHQHLAMRRATGMIPIFG